MKKIFSLAPFPRAALALSMLLGAALAAQAADPAKDATLVEGMGVSVTGGDLRGDASRLPPQPRKEMLGRPESAGQLAQNIYVRRALAAEAIAAGLDKDPNVQAQLRIARDRVLSDLRLAAIDRANMPNDEAAAKYAKEAYQADPKRFQAPEELRVRHILIKGNSAEARAKAEKILAELKGGADFETLARKSSEDTVSASNGGDLGYFGRDRMVKSFEDAAFALKQPGETSPLVESQFGFHIIQLVDRRSPGVRPFGEVETGLKEEAIGKTVSEARQLEVARLLKDAKFDKDAIEAFAASER